MRIIFGVSHPKQVHIRKNIVWNLIKRGHDVKILAINKDITRYLLYVYGLDYEIYGDHQTDKLKKACNIATCTYRALNIAKRFRPDILVGGNPYLAYVSRILRKPHIMLTDTEHAVVSFMLTYPFTDVVCTPSCFKKRINPKKHVIYNGYGELTYLHPRYFKPDSSVLDDLGLSKNDKFVIMRLVSWGAIHDVFSKGFAGDFLEKAIKSLEEYGHVFITSERKLNKNLEKYKIQIAPEKLHSALYYASLYFGEGGTTAVEAALLGTPAVHVEAFRTKSGEVVDATRIHGNFDELVNKYKMLHTFADPNQALEKAMEMLRDENAKREMRKKRERLLKEKIDVTAFMTDFIENYPESFYEYMRSKRAT